MSARAVRPAPVEPIDTGVDLDFYAVPPPRRTRRGTVVFSGAMDSRSNIDGIEFLMDEVWPLVAAARPDARMAVVGRNPPRRWSPGRAQGMPWHSPASSTTSGRLSLAGDVSVIPLRVGSGTRIKAFEAMAMGRPVVSTTLGVEGLAVVPGEHCLAADTPSAFAAEIIRLLADAELRRGLPSRRGACWRHGSPGQPSAGSSRPSAGTRSPAAVSPHLDRRAASATLARHAQFLRPDRAGGPRPGDRQRGRGQPHLHRYRRRPAGRVPRQRQCLHRDGRGGERAPPTPARTLPRQIRRAHPADPPPGCAGLHPPQAGLADLPVEHRRSAPPRRKHGNRDAAVLPPRRRAQRGRLGAQAARRPGRGRGGA